MKVRDMMSTGVVTVGPQTPWQDIAGRMLEAGVSGLPVVDDDGYLLGIVTEADLVSKPAFGDQPHRPLAVLVDILTGATHWTGKADGLTAADLMTTAVIITTPYEDMREVAQRMLDYKVQRLPVLDGGRLVGIVSRRDLVRSILDH
jgi:CBS domain-containing protein